MGEHSRLSPSSRHRWSLCPGSVREEAKYPDTSGPSAIDGTHTHTVLSHCIKNNVANVIPLTGMKMKDDDGEFIIDSARAERVQVALDYVLSRIGPGVQVFSEIRVNPTKFVGRDDMAGTADIVITNFNNRTIEIVDYKDGFIEVASENNKQLEQYMLGALAEYGERYDTLIMTIIQPKLALTSGNPISSWSISYDEFMKGKVLQFKVEAADTDDPNAPLVPGETQCYWCKHKGACTTLVSKSLEAAGITFKDMRLMEQSMIVDPIGLTNEQIAEIVKSAPLVRQMLDAVEGECLVRMQAGQTVPDLKVVYGRGSKSWKDEPDVIAARLKKFGMRQEDYWKTTIITPLQAEKLKWTNKSGVEKQLTEKQIKLMYDEYVTKSRGKLTMVPLTDAREAIQFNVSHMFEAQVPEWLKHIKEK